MSSSTTFNFAPIFDFDENLLLMSDSYKITHPRQYPKGTKKIISYLESRGGMFNATVMYGLNYLIKKYLVGEVVTMEKIDDAEQFWNAHFGKKVFPRAAWEHIVNVHNGHLPVRIKAVLEGTVVGTRNVLVLIESLDDELPWLTNYLETLIVEVWYPITVATVSREIKLVFYQLFKDATSYSDDKIFEIIDFQLHDFGIRGASSPQSAAWGGSAHLLNFKGTDNAMAIRLAQKWYNTREMLGFSVNASEHSTITSWGKENEAKAYKNMLEIYPDGIFACVSDSYDIENAVKNIWMGDELKPLILNRDGRVVIRLDSGSAKVTIKVIFDILWEKAGGHINEKGFRVLNEKIRLLQGDGVNYSSIIDIAMMMNKEKISPENLVFGMGGALLQKIDRDTQKFAFKCCALYKEVEGKLTMVEVSKSPIEFDDDGNRVVSFKKSKSGNLKLVRTDKTLERDVYKTVSSHDPEFEDSLDELVTVFEMGKLIKDYRFEEIRERARIVPALCQHS